MSVSLTVPQNRPPLQRTCRRIWLAFPPRGTHAGSPSMRPAARPPRPLLPLVHDYATLSPRGCEGSSQSSKGRGRTGPAERPASADRPAGIDRQDGPRTAALARKAALTAMTAGVRPAAQGRRSPATLPNRTAAACVVCLLVHACAQAPVQPGPTDLPAGRWSDGGACLSVAADGCDLVVGCGHGRFPRPVLRADGTFAVDGTYRIEAGPVSLDPPPPATFSGVLRGRTLTLSVAPADSRLPPASYLLQLTNASGRCAVPCL